MNNDDNLLIDLLCKRFNIQYSTKPKELLGETWIRKNFEGQRMKHVLGVVQHSYFSTSAYLHDVGYITQHQITNFHPLDGALYAIERGYDASTIKDILFHSCAMGEACLRGGFLSEIYSDVEQYITPSDQISIDRITYYDMHTSKTGEWVTIAERIDDILSRYNSNTVVYQNISLHKKYFLSLDKLN